MVEKHGFDSDISQLRGLRIVLDMHCRLGSNTRTSLWHLGYPCLEGNECILGIKSQYQHCYEVTSNKRVCTVRALIHSILHVELNLLRPLEPAPVSDETRLDHLSQIS